MTTFLRIAAVALITMAAVADSPRDQDIQRAVDAMLAEGLLETTPGGLRTVNRLLSRAFNRGVDDLDTYVYCMKLAIQQALLSAERHPDEGVATAYRAAAIPLTYNLAMNTWPGWGPGEVGDVGDAHRRLGLAAARQNVELAAELGLGPERRRNGYWALGAQLLAAGEYAEATAAFATSRDLARAAELESAVLMAQGWIHAANILAGQEEQAALAAVVEALRGLEDDDGAFYAEQYAVALRVFGRG